MRARKSLLRSTVKSVPFAVAAALVLSGCSSSPLARMNQLQKAQNDARQSALAQRAMDGAPPTQLVRPDERDYVGSAAYWGAQVQANPGDIDASLNFARNLRMMGGGNQAVSVLRDMVVRYPNESRILAEYGKALTAAERPQDAIGFLTQAIQSSPNDWSLRSARGVAYDQAGNHTAARADYAQALALDEENQTVLTNLALSYVLSGEPAQAEPILRKVVAQPSATAAMRQNMSMVLALQGKSAEAAQFARMDLEPADATSNVELFTRFNAPKSYVPAAQAKAPVQADAAAPIQAAAIVAPKVQTSLPSDFTATDGDVIAAPVAGDPMATPVQSQSIAAAVATRSPQQMMPVADDEIAPKPKAPAAAALKPKAPLKKAAPKPAPASAAAPAATAAAGILKPAAKTITSNGETLLGTINGIPVIGDSSKAKGKPEAAADGLRGRSL